jgi:hypothetical protein
MPSFFDSDDIGAENDNESELLCVCVGSMVGGGVWTIWKYRRRAFSPSPSVLCWALILGKGSAPGAVE